MKDVILLVNNAPEIRALVGEYIATFKNSDYNLVLVAESRFIKYLDEDVTLDYVFADFFEKNYRNLQLSDDKLKRLNHWEAFYSDFEREEYFNKLINDKDYYQSLVANLNNFFFHIFSERNVERIIYENISNSFAYTAFNVGELFGVKYLGLIYSRLPGRFEVLDGIFNVSERYADSFNHFMSEGFIMDPDWQSFRDNYFEEFEERQPDYMKTNGLHATTAISGKYLKSSKFDYLIKTLKYRFSGQDTKYAYQVRNPFRDSLTSFTKAVKRKIKLKVLDKYLSDVKEGEKYFLYPLHFHPESSTSVLARQWVNEETTVRNIAFSLPYGVFLYVKDHPSAAGVNSLDWYKRLSMIPNVKLIDYHYNAKKMVKKSLGVITLTSTVGFEALLLGKPVIVLGEVFYDRHPGVLKIRDLGDIKNAVQQVINSELISAEWSAEATLNAYYSNTIGMDSLHEGPTYIKKIIEKENKGRVES